jgi:hypothetical protein
MTSAVLDGLLITSAVETNTMIDRLIALEAKSDGLTIDVAQQAGRTPGVLADFEVGQ